MNTPFVLVVFGATGDLAKSKLFPSLFSLYKKNQLGEQFFIIGFARRPLGDDGFKKFLEDALKINETNREIWNEFVKNVYYQQGVFEEVEGYEELIEKLNGFDTTIGACITRLFYLATPPDNYETILNYLQTTKLSEGCGPYFAKATQGKQGMAYLFTRLIIEKPFGKDLETARHLDRKIATIFEEKQIFRVDHYLGKETVQNMIVFRFANGIFEPVWNNKYIDHVQITWGEKTGISGRGAFFDGVGLLRDVGQNHLMQLLAAVIMEQPKTFSKEGVRDARTNAIGKIRVASPKDVVRGQYIGYKEEKGVLSDSSTETFVSMKLFVDSERFSGVPFYVRAGKKMPKDVVEISIVFIQTCHLLFKEIGCPEEGNVLTIRIQPDEGIMLRVIAKKPGQKVTLENVDLAFSYKEKFGESIDNAYEKLLLDIFSGDQMLFNRSDELEHSWEFITGILEGWKKDELASPVLTRSIRGGRRSGSEIRNYKPGTWGPQEANELIEKDGRKWE